MEMDNASKIFDHFCEPDPGETIFTFHVVMDKPRLKIINHKGIEPNLRSSLF